MTNYVKNKHQAEDFKLQSNEEWATFQAPKFINNQPAWYEDTKMCPCWHIWGNSFSDCKHWASHVLADKIPASNRDGMKKIMAMVCSTKD